MWISVSAGHSAKKYIALTGPEVKTLTVDGFTFRDLNKNGKLNVYEDIRQPTEVRGMEKASQEERMLKIINAGVDQFGFGLNY
jgi:hypothetical protein